MHGEGGIVLDVIEVLVVRLGQDDDVAGAAAPLSPGHKRDRSGVLRDDLGIRSLTGHHATNRALVAGRSVVEHARILPGAATRRSPPTDHRLSGPLLPR